MWPVHGMAVSILLYLSNNSTSWLWNWRIPSVLKLLFSQVAAVVQEYDRLLAFWLRDSDTRDENSENSVNWHWTKAENERLKEDGPKDSLKAKPGENAEEFWAVRNMEKTWSTLAHSSVVKQSCAIQRELWKRQALQPELFLMNKLNCSTQRFFWFQTLISLEVQFFQRAEISKFSQYLHIFTFLKQKSYNERHWQLKLCTMNLFRKLEMRRCRSLGCRCRRSLVFPKLVEVGKRSPLEFEFRYWISWLLSCASQLSTAEAKVRFRKKKHGKIQQICRIFLSIEAYPAMWISTNFQVVVSAFRQELLWKSRDQEALAPFLTWRARCVLDCKTSVIVTGCCKMLQDLSSSVESTQSICFVHLWNEAVCVMLQCDAEVWHVSTSTEWSRPQNSEMLLHFSRPMNTQSWRDLYNLLKHVQDKRTILILHLLLLWNEGPLTVAQTQKNTTS